MKFELNATTRTLQGSGASRRLRHAKKVPGIIYGGTAAPLMIELEHNDLLLALRKGISVPGRIAMAGFNDLAGSDQMVPPLTSVRTPRSAMGDAGAQMLLQLMRGETPERNSVDLGFELCVRGSS